jgi:leucyl-tRNA synthetase
MTATADDFPPVPPFRYTASLAQNIELGWQQRWAEQHAFDVPNPVGDLAEGFAAVADRPKAYVIDMFPYPSGSGLHVGHPLGYIGSDVIARYYRMLGYLVLHPLGYDAFGLPAEQYAIETGQHPAVTTRNNIDNMRRQLRRLGLSHDPRRELSTADPSFYKWTQWIFLQIYNSWFDAEQHRARPISELIDEFDSGVRRLGDDRPWSDLSPAEQRVTVDGHRLVYLAEVPVNWCPGLGTVLANEEVTNDGRSEVGNYPVHRRHMKQWMMRITAFADRLLADLDALEWSDSLKTMQRNWIGRSEGADVRFAIKLAEDAAGTEELVVFTTRPDTLFGATFVVVAPEHALVDSMTASEWPPGTPIQWRHDGTGVGAATPRQAVDAYRRAAAARSDRERMAAGATTGVFLGTYAENPVTGDALPVFIADYVLTGYGTGAIMAVPAHDQRDFEFARCFDLPVRAVVKAGEGWLAEHDPSGTGDATAWTAAFAGAGLACNSRRADLDLDGLTTPEATHAMGEWLEDTGHGRVRVAYRLRDWLFSRQRYWGEPFPIVYDETGMPIALPVSMLPIELPEMIQFQPSMDEASDEPEPPLARAEVWRTVKLDLGDGLKVYRRETNTMPQWAGSCWYYLRYLDPTNQDVFVDPAVERFWMGSAGESHIGGVDLYIGGVEHAVLHLLYARFWHKVLFDLGHLSTPEPFQRLYNQGYILAPAYTDSQGRYVPATEVEEHDGAFTHAGQPVKQVAGKMGKSLKNSIAPDDIYAAYGADTLRLYEMAMGPLDSDRPWHTDDIVGVWRFLQRLWRNLVDETTGASRVTQSRLDATSPLYASLHRTIDAVRRLYADLRLNVAVARLTELNNSLTQHVATEGECPRDAAEAMALMLAPLAPHIAAELWERLGHTSNLDDQPFPVPDPSVLAASTVALPVTVNGRRRGEIVVAPDATEDQVMEAALRLDAVARQVEPDDIRKVVYVPAKILNIVVR